MQPSPSPNGFRDDYVKANTPFLGKWLWVLFWLVIPGEIGSLLSEELFSSALHLPTIVGSVISMLTEIVYGIILLKFTMFNRNFRLSGICYIAAAVSGFVFLFFPGEGGSTASLWLTLPTMILSLIGVCHEYTGYSQLLADIQNPLSSKWEKLWKAYAITLIIGVASMLLAFIPILGLIAILAVMVATLVISILKLVYLYKTAQIFRHSIFVQ